MLKQIEARKNLRPEQFKAEFVDQSLPVVLNGLASEWACLKKWTFPDLIASYGALEVPVRDYCSQPYLKKKMRMDEYLNYWASLPESGPIDRPNLYLAEWNFAPSCPELLQDFVVPPHFAHDWINELPKSLQFARTWIFIGHPGVQTPMHTDTFSSSAWLAMIEGAKLIRLVHPRHEAAMVRGTDLFDPATVEALGKQGIEVIDARIGKGDILFIPGRWFHQVRNADKNIMLTRNFVDDPHFLHFYQDFSERLLKPMSHLNTVRDRYLEAHRHAAV